MKLSHLVVAAGVFAAVIAATPGAHARSAADATVAETAVLVAQLGESGDGRLAPRYEPVPPEEPCWYNSDYLFAMTRGLSDSTIHPAAKAPLFLFAVPLDIVLLPATLIGGFFG